MKLFLANKLIPILSGLKSWIFSDGKFNLNRSIVLLCTLGFLTLTVQYIPVETLEHIVNLLDDISDIYGYN